jgi:hypothetical protein
MLVHADIEGAAAASGLPIPNLGYRRHPREMIAGIGANEQLDWLRFSMV